ncbi:MAG TPA: pirin family protein [Steroidobacteraceae bacterium]|nr:pirin family protein [Steroidobacteraceae bacterium]
MKKAVLGVYPAPKAHWVGDGFPVRSLFSYDQLGRHISPFLLLDYAAPTMFSPAVRPRGVGEHPHRGFETVTIVYQGEVAHRDSVGNSGVIGPGDVQWMTAAAGILHDEFHSPAFMRRGGELEMAQLWVNLPAKHKMAPPQQGPAATFSELNVWDVRLRSGTGVTLSVPEGHSAAIAVLRGAIVVNGAREAQDAELVLLERTGRDIHIAAGADSTILVLSGVPIAEPIAGYGPFVMNTRQEIETAMNDFRLGKFGQMPPLEIAADRAGAGAI